MVSNPAYLVILPGVAVALDFALGDPEGFPHPVRAIGKAAMGLESWARQDEGRMRLKGVLALFGLCVIVGVLAWVLVRVPVLGIVAAVYLAYAGLGLGCLLREGRAVARLLDQGCLIEARKALAGLVSRETTDLDEAALRRTLAETMSENLNDAFVAPLFYLCLFGVPGLWVYKTVSTLDSMWGYRTGEYRLLGWASARADDVLAWIPARLTWLALVAAGGILGLPWERALLKTPLEARKMDSPNAGWPMSAVAWLCGARMGGEYVYFGKIKSKPVLGPRDDKAGEWHREAVSRLFRLVTACGILSGTVAQVLVIVFV